MTGRSTQEKIRRRGGTGRALPAGPRKGEELVSIEPGRSARGRWPNSPAADPPPAEVTSPSPPSSAAGRERKRPNPTSAPSRNDSPPTPRRRARFAGPRPGISKRAAPGPRPGSPSSSRHDARGDRNLQDAAGRRRPGVLRSDANRASIAAWPPTPAGNIFSRLGCPANGSFRTGKDSKASWTVLGVGTDLEPAKEASLDLTFGALRTWSTAAGCTSAAAASKRSDSPRSWATRPCGQAPDPRMKRSTRRTPGQGAGSLTWVQIPIRNPRYGGPDPPLLTGQKARPRLRLDHVPADAPPKDAEVRELDRAARGAPLFNPLVGGSGRLRKFDEAAGTTVATPPPRAPGHLPGRGEMGPGKSNGGIPAFDERLRGKAANAATQPPAITSPPG